MLTEAETTKSRNNNSSQLFKNPFLEKLTRTHIAVPITILNLAAAIVLYWGIANIGLGVLEIILLFLVGALAFTLVEYVIHKYVFHMMPDTKIKADIQYKVHGVHHDFPKEKDRLAMPPPLSIVLSILFFLFFRMIMGDYAYGFMPGFLFGYTAYLFVHYIVHAWQPPNNIFKELWIHHGIHHYKDSERAFGVSSPLWDFIFRTLPKRKRK